MTDLVGRARYELEADARKVKTGVADAEKAIKASGAEAERAFGQQATGAVSKFGTSLQGLDDRLTAMTKRGGISGAILGGVGLGAGLSVFNTVQNLVSGALGKISQSIDLASDKAEAASKAQVLFGDSYYIVEEASRTAATAVGLSSGVYLAAAGDVANLIQNFGIAGDEAAGMSRDIVQLAADMGSFNNASTVDVTAAIGAAFRGETEPIRRFGVMLDAAAVANKAVEMGLAKSTRAVDKEAKARATYQLILDQTTKAQGDFARTSDGYANAQRIAAAKQEESLTRLGEAIKPLALTLLPLLADAGTLVVEALTAIAGPVAALVEGALKGFKDVLAGINEQLGRLADLADGGEAAAQRELEQAIREVAEARGYDAEQVLAHMRATRAGAAAARDAATARRDEAVGLAEVTQWVKANIEQVAELVPGLAEANRLFKGNAEQAGYANERYDALLDRVVSLARETDAPLREALEDAAGLMASVGQGAMTLDQAMTHLADSWGGVGHAAGNATTAWGQALPQMSAAQRRQLEVNRVFNDFARIYGPSAKEQVEAFSKDWADLAKQLLRGEISTGDWVSFITENLDLIRTHFDELPADLQKAMRAAGIVVETEAGDWAGTIKVTYQKQLVNSMQGFWTGTGQGIFQPPAGAIAPTPETLALVADAGKQIAGALRLDFSGSARKGMSGAFRFIENNLGPGLKGAILSAKDDIDKAMDEVRWVINHPRKWAKAVDDTEGAIKKLLRQRDKALRDGNPGLARYLEGQAGMMIGNWEQLTGVAWDESLTIGQNFANGLRRKKPEVRGAANELAGAARGPLKEIPAHATTYGTNYGRNLAAGMRSQISAVRDAAGALARATANQNRISSPAKEGPWSEGGGPEGWGRRYGLMIAQGMRSARSDVAMASAQLAGTAPSLAGWTMTASASQTVRHEHEGRVEVRLSSDTITTARQQGASWDDVGRMAAAARTTLIATPEQALRRWER